MIKKPKKKKDEKKDAENKIKAGLKRFIQRHRKYLNLKLYLESYFLSYSFHEHIDKLPANKKAFIMVYKNNAGNIAGSCKAVGISRRTFYYWCQDSKEFDACVKEVDESLLDFSESKLIQNIQDGKEASLIFHLKTKGKDRGYVERQEFSGIGGKPLDVRIKFVGGRKKKCLSE
jgi:hypothetical protein